MANPHVVSKRRVVVTFSPSPEVRRAFADALDAGAVITYLPDVGEGGRARALASADAMLSWSLEGELRGPEELGLIESVGLVQLLSAGVDHVPFDRIPEGVPVASNAGAYAEPMAEHVLAMALALAKRLPQNHAAMARGEFDQQTPTRAIRGSLVGIVGIVGFGGIGQASARLFRALCARVHAINRSGHTDEPVERIGTLGELDAVLAASDVLVVSFPLTRVTRGLIGERELSLMRSDAILVNVARRDRRRGRPVRASAPQLQVLGGDPRLVAGTALAGHVRHAQAVPGPAERPRLSTQLRHHRRLARCGGPPGGGERRAIPARRAGAAPRRPVRVRRPARAPWLAMSRWRARHAAPLPQSYEIRVRGHLGPTTLCAFDGLRVETRGRDTILTGALPDQAALHGVLAQIEALGLELLELGRLPPS